MAQYRTGTVSTTAGSTEVLGTGTSWLTANPLQNLPIRPGYFMQLQGDGLRTYVIASVDDDGTIQLETPYPDTRTDITYVIVSDFTANRGYPLANKGDLNFAEIYSRAMKMIDEDNYMGLIWGGVVDGVLDTAPVSPADGDIYIVYPDPPSGDDWDNHLNDFAEWDATSPGSWIFTTPSERTYVFDLSGGSIWLYVEGAWVEWLSQADLDSTYLRLDATNGPVTGSLDFSGATIRFLGANGIYLGSSGDVQIYRSAANTARTPDSLIVDTNLTVSGAGDHSISNRLALPTTGASAGLLIGGDALWYRSAVDTMRTPDSLVIDTNLTVSGAGPHTIANQLQLSTTGSSAGVLIGGDAQIYRDGADELRTPDSLRVDGFAAVGAALNTARALNISKAFGNPSATVYGSFIAPGVTLSANNANINVGLQVQSTFNQNGFNGTQARGNRGVDSIADISGSSGTVTGASAFDGIVRNTAAGTLTNAYVYYGRTIVNSGGGVVTNAYGLYLEAQTVGSTLNYAIWTNGTEGSSFGGQLALRTTGSTAGILIGGDFRIYRDAANVGRTPHSFYVDGSLRAIAGSSSSHARVGGVINVNTTTVGNVGTGEDDLMSYSVPASTLGTNGDSLDFIVMGTLNIAPFQSADVTVYFGATAVLDISNILPAGTPTKWVIRGTITRTGATTQIANAFGYVLDDFGTVLGTTINNTAPAETLSGAVTFKTTGESSAATNNVVQQTLSRLMWYPTA